MSILGKTKRFLEIGSTRRKKGKKRQSKKRTPPRGKSGRFKSR